MTVMASMRSEGSWPSDFKRLIGVCRGIAGALAISFAAIPSSRSSSDFERRRFYGRCCFASIPEEEDRCQICADRFSIQAILEK
jgi:hypothetical protein